jgi:hypothetical protein
MAKAAAERATNTGGAAILLSAVERLRIQGNRIVGNGELDRAYAGVLLGVGEGIIISDNVISDNGRHLQATGAASGGIRIQLAMPESAPRRKRLAGLIEGWPALAIRDNVIDSLNGPAIFAKGIGEIQISRNKLTSKHLGRSNTDASVVVADMGPALDALANREILVALPTSGPGATSLGEIGGVVHFSDNQISYLPDTESEGPAVFVSSHDDLSFTNNQIRILAENPRVKINSLVKASSVRVIGNRFVEVMSGRGILSCLGQAEYMVGVGNEATNCLRLTGNGIANTQVQLNIVINRSFCEKFTEFMTGGHS